MKKIIILLVCILPFMYSGVKAQYAISLYNSSTNPVTFSLSYDNAIWNEYTLSGSKLQQYSLGTNLSCWIRIETKSNGPMSSAGVVKYQLNNGRKYQLYWNLNSMHWDLTEYK